MINVFVKKNYDRATIVNECIKHVNKLNNTDVGEYFKDEEGRPKLSKAYMSLSHTQDIIVLAISDCPVGVDIENKNRSINPKLGVTVKGWTECEAYAKYTGRGIFRQSLKEKIPNGLIKSLNVVEDFYISLCTKEKDIKVYILGGKTE